MPVTQSSTHYFGAVHAHLSRAVTGTHTTPHTRGVGATRGSIEGASRDYPSTCSRQVAGHAHKHTCSQQHVQSPPPCCSAHMPYAKQSAKPMSGLKPVPANVRQHAKRAVGAPYNRGVAEAVSGSTHRGQIGTPCSTLPPALSKQDNTRGSASHTPLSRHSEHSLQLAHHYSTAHTHPATIHSPAVATAQISCCRCCKASEGA